MTGVDAPSGETEAAEPKGDKQGAAPHELHPRRGSTARGRNQRDLQPPGRGEAGPLVVVPRNRRKLE